MRSRWVDGARCPFWSPAPAWPGPAAGSLVVARTQQCVHDEHDEPATKESPP